jgi:hypothetical protein
MLVETIESKPTVTVFMTDQDSHGRVANSRGDFNVYLDRNISSTDRYLPMRDSQGNVVPNPFNIIAGHEVLGHARLEILGDPGYVYDGPGSKTFQIENVLRKEQGLPPRPEDEP